MGCSQSSDGAANLSPSFSMPVPEQSEHSTANGSHHNSKANGTQSVSLGAAIEQTKQPEKAVVSNSNEASVNLAHGGAGKPQVVRNGQNGNSSIRVGAAPIPAMTISNGGLVGGATAALASVTASSASASSGTSGSFAVPTAEGATAALAAASAGTDDISSIGSMTAGSLGENKSNDGVNGNANNNGALDRSHRSSSGLHRSRISLGNSSSVIGLDSMIESRREEGGLTANVVHMEVPFGKPIEEVYDGVQTGPVLGSGISGVVRLVTHKATGVKYAVKCLDLGLVDTEEGLMQLREEIYIMCQLDHPNIVRLEEVYESHSEIYLVQELCLGGELFDRLDEQPDYHYTEAECAKLIKQMLCAVRYLHSKGIIHRDLKLENFLFSSSAPDSELKMIDFGLSKHFQYGEIQQQAVGTPYTVAPEVIRGRYDERCDIWAIGVIAFLLLSGEPPFGGCGGPEPLMTVRANILNGAYEFEPFEIWDLVSDSAKDFIKALLVTDPKFRPTASNAQKQPWLTEWAHKTKTDNDHILNPNVVRALVNFKEFSDMRKLLCEVLSFTLLPEQIKDLRKEFETLDTEGSGEISLLSLKQVLVTNAGAGSLGALTEEEVEDIFNAMRVKKTETTIRWHEFIAAGLSQCEVDDRNLRLAFDRLDNDHKGYVTLDDIMDLMGSDAVQGEEALRKMWGDSMKDCNCSLARITYEDFVLIMKGQTREFEDGEGVARSDSGQRLNGALMHAVNEVDEAETTLRSSLSKSNSNRKSLSMEENETDQAGETVMASTPQLMKSLTGFLNPSAPDGEYQESPFSMDDDDDVAMPAAFPVIPTFSPPSTPKRGPSSPRTEPKIRPLSVMDEVMAQTINSDPETNIHPLIPNPKPNIIHVRVKSRSFDEREMKKSFCDVDSRRAVALPEHDPDMRKSLIMNDKQMSALQVNRQLYRSHRQMRLSVIDACKRFEDHQARHAHGVLLAEKNMASMGATAGLVMRRVDNKTVSSEEIKQRLEQNRRQQQKLMDKANRRSGGRRSSRRKKTVSDLSTMMGSLSSEEMTKISIQAHDTPRTPLTANAPNRVENTTMYNSTIIPTVIETKPLENTSDDTNFRPATVPGEFRRVNDPFGSHGKYASMMTSK